MRLFDNLSGRVRHFLFRANEGSVSTSYIVITAVLAVLGTSVVTTVKLGLHNDVNGIVTTMLSAGTQDTSASTGGTITTSSSSTASTAADAAIAAAIHQMGQEQFPDIPPDQIKYLLPSQLAAMTNPWWFGQIPEASKMMLSAEQIKAVPPTVVGPHAGELTSEQVGWLSDEQVHAAMGDWAVVDMVKKLPSVATKLTPDQMASIKSDWYFKELVNTAGDSLTKTQIQAALPSTLGPNAGQLTAEQIGWLTSDQFNAATGGWAIGNMVKKMPSVAAKLSADQMASIEDPWWIGELVNTAGSSLKKTQIQAVLPSALSPKAGLLSAEQIGWLTDKQLSAVMGDDPIGGIVKKVPSVVTKLSTDQIASMKNSWWFGQIVKTAGSSLTKAQIQAARPSTVGPNEGLLTAEQIGWLSNEQVHAAMGDWAIVDMVKKVPAMVTKLTPDQMASLKSDWWFKTLVNTAGTSLTKPQIQAARPSTVGPNEGLLTAEQIGWLTNDQVTAATGGWAIGNMLKKVPSVMTKLKPTQIASIKDPWWFGQMPGSALQSMNESQVNAIPDAAYSNIKGSLTATQQAWRS